jgi:hypothetical protein
LLKEVFFVKETEQLILMKQREIKVLDESNLTWSMEQKESALKYIDDLQAATRDKSQDELYILRAHQYLKTNDPDYFSSKMRSVRLPFTDKFDKDKDGKLDTYSHKKFDMSKRQVPLPKQGGRSHMLQNYDQEIGAYFQKLEYRDAKQRYDAIEKSNHVVQELQKNRKLFHEIKSKS